MDLHLEQTARQIAATANVDSFQRCIVLYSVSFLPTKENKHRALAYLREHPEAMIIDDTECGKKLAELGINEANFHTDADRQTVAEIWKIASKRFIKKATGNVVAFVDHADHRSVFRSLELPSILQNPGVATINGIDKFQFAFQFGL